MAFCSKCGASLSEGVAYCARCGAPTSSSPSGGPPPLPATGGMPPNVAAALAYLLGFITGIAFLVIEPYKNDRFVRFHAFQSIFASVAYFIFWSIWTRVIVFGFFSMGLFWTMLTLLGSVISLAAFLCWLFLMYKAYNNERFMIPVIGEYAARQAG